MGSYAIKVQQQNKVYLFYFFLKIQNCLQKCIIECRSKNYGSIGCIVNNLEFERLKTYIFYSSGHLIITFLNKVHTFFPKIVSGNFCEQFTWWFEKMVQKYQYWHTHKNITSFLKNWVNHKSHLLLLNTALDNLPTQVTFHMWLKVSTKTQLSVTIFSHLPWAWSDATQSHNRKLSAKCAKFTLCSTSLSGFTDLIFLIDVFHMHEQNTINIQGLIYSWTLRQKIMAWESYSEK